MDDRPRRCDVETLADAIAAARPAGIDQVDPRAVCLDALHQQFGVDTRGARKEGGPETGRKSRRVRLRGPDDRRSHRRGIAREEVVGRRLLRQDRHRRQHAADVAGQEDHRVRLAAAVLGHLGLDVPARIAGAGVLGQRSVAVVRFAGVRVHHHVLDDGPEADRIEDHRFVVAAQVDALGVAAALEVEHGALAPAVLVVADQQPIRVCRKRCLAGARQAEEQGHIAIGPGVGGAVHRQHAMGREQVVLHAEHRLFHLAGVTQARKQHAATREVDHHRGIGGGPVPFGLADESRCIEHVPKRLAGRVELVRRDEKRLGEQRMPGVFRRHVDRQVVFGIRADMKGRGKRVTLCHVRLDAGEERVEHPFLDGLIDRSPVDLRLGTRFAHDEPILRRTPGAAPGLYHQGAVRRESTFAPKHGQLRERSARKVAVGSGLVGDVDVQRHQDRVRERLAGFYTSKASHRRQTPRPLA